MVGRRIEEARPEVPEGLGKDRRHVGVGDEGERPQPVALDELPAPPPAPLEGPAGGHEAERRHAEKRLDLLRVLDARVEVLEEEGHPHAANEAHHARQHEVERALRSRRPARDLGAIDDVDVRGQEGGRDLGLAQPPEERGVELAARVDLAPEEIVFRHAIGQTPRHAPVLDEGGLHLLLGPGGRLVVGAEGLHGPAELGLELAAALGDLLGELLHPWILRLEDLTEPLIVGLLSGQVLLELDDQPALENDGQ